MNFGLEDIKNNTTFGIPNEELDKFTYDYYGISLGDYDEDPEDDNIFL